MSRNILPSAQAYLDTASSIRIAHLVKIELAESVEGSIYSYVTDYASDITYGGQTYQASKVISVGDVTQTQGFRNYKVQLNIAGEFAEEIEKGLADHKQASYRGRHIEILRAYLDDSGAIIPFSVTTNGPLEYFLGEISDINIKEDVTKGNSVVTWECVGAFQDFESVNGRITEDKSHRGIVVDQNTGLEVPSDSAKKVAYQSDTGFQHATSAIEASIKYTTTETRYKMTSSWFGLKSKMKEYEAQVTKEVDLGLSLSAKYLPVVYGVRKIDGIPVFVDVPSNNPRKLYVVYAFCEGEIDAFLDIYVDSKPSICLDANDSTSRVCYGSQVNGDTLSAVPGIGGADRTTGTYHGDSFTINNEKGSIKFTVFHGTSSQTAHAGMVSIAAGAKFLIQKEKGLGSTYWDANSRLLDTAYIVAEIDITEDQQELPQISAVVSGKLVSTFDSAGNETTGQYTLNPVWHLLDYMRSDVYGGSLASSEINLKSFYDVATFYDQYDKGVSSSYQGSWVKFWRYLGWKYPDGVTAPGDIPQMQCNTLLKGSDPVTSNIDSILQQMDGTINILANKYHLSIENNDTPTVHIDISECQGSIPTKDNTGKSKWNAIQASIIDPAKLWQTTQINFFNSVYKVEDNNLNKKGNIGFPHITNYYTGRFWAERQLKKSRFSRDITLTLPPKFIQIYPNMNVTFTYSRFNYVLKTFRVKSVTLKTKGMVSVVLEDYDSSIYESSTQVDNSSNQTPIIPVVRPPENLQYIGIDVAPITASKPNVYGILCWTESPSSGVFAYEVADWINGDARYSVPYYNTVNISGEDKIYIEIYDVVPATEYTFKVRSLNHQGNFSKYAELTVEVVAGADPNALPSPSNLQVTNLGKAGVWVGSSLDLSWELPEVLEGINHYTIELRSANDTVLYGTHAVGPGATTFSYTIELNIADYASNNASDVGAYRDITPRIRSENALATVYSDWVYLE